MPKQECRSNSNPTRTNHSNSSTLNMTVNMNVETAFFFLNSLSSTAVPLVLQYLFIYLRNKVFIQLLIESHVPFDVMHRLVTVQNIGCDLADSRSDREDCLRDGKHGVYPRGKGYPGGIISIIRYFPGKALFLRLLKAVITGGKFKDNRLFFM